MAKKKGNTHKIIPIKPNKLIKIFEKLGLKQMPPSGGSSHIPMIKSEMLRPAVVVKHGVREIEPNAIKGLLKTANITEKQYLEVFNSI
jgi:predicted RNA binding protein YcfA (HicA-like mRNA interferase family)